MKPTDDTIALVAFLSGREWSYADELASALKRLGFERPSSQWVAGRLGVMVKEGSPRFQRRIVSTGTIAKGVWEYRATSWAATGLSNTWRGFHTPPDLPTPKPEERA